MTSALFVALLICAAGFAFVNGFHDVSNSVALAVRTRALSPRIAVALSAFFTFAGVLLGTGIASIFLLNLHDFPKGPAGLEMLVSAALAASIWGILTWRIGIPSSSTHALIGGILGAVFADGLLGHTHNVDYLGSLWLTVVLPLILSPILAFVLAFVAMIRWVRRSQHSSPSRLNARNRSTQSILAAVFSIGHGMQDGQRTILLLVMALASIDISVNGTIPWWTQLFAAFFLALGALAGGWRISYTIGYRIIRVDPARAMVAQAVSTVLLFASALWFHLPVSSTQTLTSALVGTGVYQRFPGLRSRVLTRIVLIWLTTAPATAALSAILFLALSPLADR